MIIVEGPDGGGKSTLVQVLSNRLDIIPQTKAVSSQMTVAADLGLKHYIEEHLTMGFGPRLYDRFALVSGPIYGPFFGMTQPNDVFENQKDAAEWQVKFRQMKPIIIYCLPPLRDLKRNLMSSFDDTNRNNVDVFTKIYWAYQMAANRDIASGTGCTYTYDYTADSALTVESWVRQLLHERGISIT